MASGDQIKALLKSRLEGDDDHFFAVAMQVAAHEARLGHGKLAQELRAVVDEAKGRLGQPGRFPSAAREENWRISWKCHTRRPVSVR